MNTDKDKRSVSSAGIKINRYVLWAILFVLTAGIIFILHFLNMPAAPLIGAIIAGIIIALFGDSEMKIPGVMFQGAQSILGCMIARIFTLSVFVSILDHWLIVLFCVVSMLVFSFGLGWLLSVRKVMPGSTAMWGSWPGAASTMVILSESYGGDIRLVAFMQYMRVVVVALVASFVAMYFGVNDNSVSVPFAQYLFPPVNIKPLLMTLGFAAGCTVAARLMRLPAGPLLIAMILGAVLVNIGILNIELPQWLLVISYLIIGWSIGLRFTRKIVKYALRALPHVLGAIIILILLCAGVSAVLVFAGGIDPLTAYLAASPGGADSVAIIAASSDVDMPFVMSVQIMRFVVILLIGPSVAKRIKIKDEKNTVVD